MKIAKPRTWTTAEIEEAIAAIRKEPGLWGELSRIEAKAGEFRDVEAGVQERRIDTQLHPECELNEITELMLGRSSLATNRAWPNSDHIKRRGAKVGEA
jgi:hypothetical protein